MTDLVFYTNPQSRGRIVRWMLEEVGEPYETQVLDYATTMKDDAYRAINPMLKVPAIRHGDQVVTEVAAICAYLADAFPQAGLAPAPADRAAYYRWLFFTAGPLEAAVINKALGVEVPADRRAMVGYVDIDRIGDVLEEAVSRTPFVAGDRFSAADVVLGSGIGWYTQFGFLPGRPAFSDYLARVQARPAYQRATDIDNALLPPKP